MFFFIFSHKVARNKFFSNLATLMNFWRLPGTCHKIREKWANTFKERRNDPCCARVLPRPLKGRWGSAFDCSTFLLEAGREQTLNIMKQALSLPIQHRCSA